MQIDVKFKVDVPYSMAIGLVNEMTELAKLFDATHSVVVHFNEGEEQRMIDVENSRIKQISKGGLEHGTQRRTNIQSAEW